MTNCSSTYQADATNQALTSITTTPIKPGPATAEIKPVRIVPDPWTIFESRQESNPSTPDSVLSQSSGRDGVCEVTPTSLFHGSAGSFDDAAIVTKQAKSFDEMIESELDDIIDHVVRWNRRRR